MSKSKRKLLILVSVNIIILVLLETGLRLVDFAPPHQRPDPFRGYFGSYRVYGVEKLPPLGTFYRPNPNKLSTFQLDYFPVQKRKDRIRVFCLGGSLVNGGVYRESFVRCLKLLAGRDPWGRCLEIINAGGNGYDTGQVLHLAREVVRYQPDIIVVATGHNEFSALRYHRKLLQQSALVRRINLALDGLRLTHLIRRLIFGRRYQQVLFTLEPPGGPITGDERNHIIRTMSRNLRDIVRLGSSTGAKIVLCPAPANLEYPPIGVDRGTGALFLQAEEYLAEGRSSEARRLFQQALDQDSCPKRTVSGQIEIIRQVAAETGARFIDFQQLLAEHSPHRIPGNDLFLDFCHPNFEGCFLMAGAVLSAFKTMELPDPEPLPEPEYFSLPRDLPSSPEQLGELLDNSDPALALAAAIALAAVCDEARYEPLKQFYTGHESPIVRKLFVSEAGRAAPRVVPLLLDTLMVRPLACEARQALLTITGQYFGLRSFRLADAVKLWDEWWAENKNDIIEHNSRRRILTDALDTVITRLDSDDLNVRTASIQILDELTGERLGYDPLAPERDRKAAVERWNRRKRRID